MHYLHFRRTALGLLACVAILIVGTIRWRASARTGGSRESRP
jgi:hypothetical protein